MLTTTLLLTITIVSLILTVALAALVVKLTRDERRRSAARVAALTRLADTAAEEHDFSFELDDTDDDDLTFDRLEHASRPGDLFAAHEPHTHSEWPHRLGIVVAVAIIVAIATMGVRWRSTTLPPSTTERVAGSAPSAQAPGLLELMSLKHTQDATTLTINGVVQNPRDGVPLTRVAATAFLFGADGSFIANGRAPLDFTLLRPGDESAFTISVPVSTAVARYRVGFRGEDGRIIGHVDRRGSSTIATLIFDRPRVERGPS